MKFKVCYVFKKFFNLLNMPEFAVVLGVLPVGFLMAFLDYADFQSSYINNVVCISVYSEDNTNFKKQLLLEIEKELKKNNLEFVIKADTTATEVFIYQINTPDLLLNDWCIYIGRQAFFNLKEKNKNLHCFKSLFYVTNK